MKSIRKFFPARFRPVVICAVIFLMTIASNSGLVFAGNYSVAWWHMQKRTYEDGRSFNRLGFGIIDEFGAYVTNDVIKSVSLVGPSGAIALDPHAFMTYEILSGRINTDTGQWEYETDFRAENYCRVNFSGNLVEGDYTLEVIDEDDDTMSNSYATHYFNGVVALPEFTSKSFRGFEDVDGNFYWQWDTPVDTALWSSSLDASIRCWLTIYNGNVYVGEVYISVPALLGGVYVPSRVMDLSRQKGDRITIGMHIRTNDNNNRFYTKDIALSALRKERRKAAVVIPMF